MSTASTTSEAVVANLNRRIAEAELRSTAATDALAALIRSEADATEAERHLYEEMATLLVLRRQLAEFLLLKSV